MSLLFGWGSPAWAEDQLTCQMRADVVTCEVDVRGFFEDEIREVLNNGWENSLHFSLILTDDDDNVVGISYTELAQRCYIDPFDDPCLVLWSGQDAWQSYDDVAAMIAAIGTFGMRSVTEQELTDGTYTARLRVELNPITTEQARLIRSWLARNRGGHLVVGKSESSIFGTFVSVFANIRPGHAEATTDVLAAPFSVAEPGVELPDQDEPETEESH